MAYGGKNTRSSISDQITAAIEADMESSSSETTGKGFSLGQRIISDTQSEVAKLKSDADKGSKAGVIRNRKDKKDDDSSLASDLFGFAKNWISEIRGAAEETAVAKVGKAADLIPEKEEVAYFPEVEVNPKVISGQLEERSNATDSLMAKPVSTKDFSKQISGLVKASGDDEFPEAVEMFAEKFDITPNEVYAVINGENKDWKYDGTNKGGYKGLFQIGKGAADFAGIDYKSIANKSPTEQLALYDTYLTAWNYDNTIPLALYQAAPGRASELKNKSDDTVVYPKGSPQWRDNKGWRSSNNGDITKGSLISYYRQ
jgi:hypothetical protein